MSRQADFQAGRCLCSCVTRRDAATGRLVADGPCTCERLTGVREGIGGVKFDLEPCDPKKEKPMTNMTKLRSDATSDDIEEMLALLGEDATSDDLDELDDKIAELRASATDAKRESIASASGDMPTDDELSRMQAMVDEKRQQLEDEDDGDEHMDAAGDVEAVRVRLDKRNLKVIPTDADAMRALARAKRALARTSATAAGQAAPSPTRLDAREPKDNPVDKAKKARDLATANAWRSPPPGPKTAA
jgi:hypothetical protein